MPFNTEVKKNIIRKLISNQDYRDEIHIIIDEIFFQFCIDFLKKIAKAKIDFLGDEADWYKSVFLNLTLKKEEIAINSGLNMKSITNAYNSSKKEIVINAAYENYIRLKETIKNLAENENDLQMKLSIRYKDVSVDLTVDESLIVINTLAVKRSEIRGGMWSAVGKQIEKPLMLALCKIYEVPFEFHNQENNPESFREVDFYLLSKDGQKLRTEVKLMGKGNPESAMRFSPGNPLFF